MGNDIGKLRDDCTRKMDAFKTNQNVAVRCMLDGVVSGASTGIPLGAASFYLNKMQMESMASNPALKPEQKRHMEQMAQYQPKTLPAAIASFVTLIGVQAALTTGIKHFRKDKDDVWNVVLPAVGGGASFALVQGNYSQVPTMAFGFAAFSAVFFQASRYFGWDNKSQDGGADGGSAKAQADLQYAQSKIMLDTLGLGKYHRNVKNGLLTDQTIMLWTDSALKEVGVPPGPRLLVLYHIEQVARQHTKNSKDPLLPSTVIEVPDSFMPDKGKKK